MEKDERVEDAVAESAAWEPSQPFMLFRLEPSVGVPLHHWSHSSSITQISENTSPPSSSASFVYLLCTVATVRADIQWWICVIPFQLLICIESVPPGDINQHVYELTERMLGACHCHQLQWWDISHYATGAVFQSKLPSHGHSGEVNSSGGKEISQIKM